MVMFSIFWIAVFCLITLLLRIVFEVVSSALCALWDAGWIVALTGGISTLLILTLILIFEMSVGETSVFNGVFFIIIIAIACVIVTALLVLLCLIGLGLGRLLECFADFFRSEFENWIKKLTKKLEKA